MSTTPFFQSSTSNTNINKKWAPPLRTVEETTRLLKPDSGTLLEELKLCWREPGVLKKDSLSAPGLLNKKNLAALERALKKTPSRLTRLSVGWKHGGCRKPLIQLLQLFVQYSGRPALKDLDSIELVLAAWIPDTTLLQVLLPYASQLKTLHIQTTRMKVRTKKPPPTSMIFKNAYQSVHAVEKSFVLEEESVVKLLAIHPTLTSQLTNLTTLAFVDCDILDAEVDILVKFLWRHYSSTSSSGRNNSNIKDHENNNKCAEDRRGGGGLSTLSLRSNRHMSPKSLQRIVMAPVSDCLDLSLCNITNAGAIAIARAFQPNHNNNNNSINNNWRQRNKIVLQRLSMCGNYQLDEVGFQALAKSCPNHVQEFDLSYCAWTENQTLFFLEEMVVPTATPKSGGAGGGGRRGGLLDPSCPLKELIVQGSKVNNDDVCRRIGTILTSNRSLTKLTLDDPKYTTPISSLHRTMSIVNGLKVNYNLRELHMDLHSLKRQKQMLPSELFEVTRQVYNEMEFYLILNRAGRGLLQSDEYLDKESWMTILSKARQSGRLDVMFWLLRNAVVHLF